MKYFVIPIFLLANLPFASKNENDFKSWNRDGVPVEDGSMKTNNGFGGSLILTKDADYSEKWEKPTPGVSFSGADSAKVGDTVFVLPVFAKPKEANGKCNVRLSMRVLDPDGKVYGEMKDTAAWTLSAPPKNNLQMSQAIMGIRLEPQDKKGLYTVECILRDENRHAKVSLNKTFVVK